MLRKVPFDDFQVFISRERLQRPAAVDETVQDAHPESAAQEFLRQHAAQVSRSAHNQDSACRFGRRGIHSGKSVQCDEVFNRADLRDASILPDDRKEAHAVQLHVGNHAAGQFPVPQRFLGELVGMLHRVGIDRFLLVGSADQQAAKIRNKNAAQVDTVVVQHKRAVERTSFDEQYRFLDRCASLDNKQQDISCLDCLATHSISRIPGSR